MPAKIPLSVIMGNGNSAHLTKAEIEERKKTEIKAEADNIIAPEHLTKEQTEKFNSLANELKRANIISNLDSDLLARYVEVDSMYITLTKKLRSKKLQDNIFEFEKTLNMQDKAFKQCQAAAKELGLSVSSRCKLTAPKKEEPKENKFSRFQKGVI